MSALRTVVDAPALLAVGWFVVFSLWATTMAAVGLMLWRMMRPREEPRVQYTAASLALATGLLASVAMPTVLLITSGRRPAQQDVVAIGTSHVERTHALVGASRASDAANAGPRLAAAIVGFSIEVPARLLGILGIGWGLGAAFCLVRLLGGWLRANHLRRAAVDIAEGPLHDAFIQLASEAGVPGTRLAVSPAIDAPAAVGSHAPTVLMPGHFVARLHIDTIGPILAHELAHVARRDYLGNLAQSLVEAVLFHSPATWWIGHRIRDAREFACDDRAVAAAGDRTRYVEALTLLAGLGAASAPQPVVGMAGPRLITRVRRLLEGEPIMHAPVLRALVTGLCGLGLAAALPAPFTLASAQLSRRLLAAGQVEASRRLPIGFPQKQEGSALRIKRVDSTATHACGTFDVQNVADVAVDRVRVVAVLSFAPGANRPVQIVESEWIPLDLAPGAAGRVEASLVDIAATLRETAGGHVQALCALKDVVYANRASWSTTVNPAATDPVEAMGWRRPTLPRDLVGVTSAMVTSNLTLCLDDEAAEYSPGAQIEIRDEPGRQARCTTDGRWVEVLTRAGAEASGRATVADEVTMELMMAGIEAPFALVSPYGRSAIVASPTRSWGLVPRRTPTGGIQLALHDLSTHPHQLVATRSAGPDGTIRFDEVEPSLTIRVRER